MSYEDLLEESEQAGLIVREKPIHRDGMIYGKRIAIRQDISTIAKKADVLAEELGHHYTTVGNIIEQDSTNARKQERTARLWAYNKRIGLYGLIRAYQHHCQNLFEIADYLDVSEDTLSDALEHYRQKYGTSVRVEHYMIQFEPHFGIVEFF